MQHYLQPGLHGRCKFGTGHDVITSIVVNYRCANLTCRAVESLQADMPQAAIVVVDNSVDRDEAAALRAGLPGQARLVLSPRNIGFGAACNLGVQESGTDYVMLLNPDARVFPGCLEQLKSALDTDGMLGAVSPLQYWDTSRNWLLPPAWLPTGPGMAAVEQAWRSHRWASQLSLAYRQYAITAWAGKEAPVEQRALSGGAMMVRLSALSSEEKLFDPSFFMYYEDSDLSLRLKRHGRKLALITRAAALHEWENVPGKAPLMEASQGIYLEKHFHSQSLWQARRARLAARRPVLENPLNAQILESGQRFLDVPRPWQSRWLLELSPSPLMIPAIGHLGSGPLARLPLELLKRFRDCPAYLRIGPVEKARDGRLLTFVVRSTADGSDADLSACAP